MFQRELNHEMILILSKKLKWSVREGVMLITENRFSKKERLLFISFIDEGTNKYD